MGSGVLGGGTPEQAVQPQSGEESQESREGEPCVGEASPEANQRQTGGDCSTGVSVSQILSSNSPIQQMALKSRVHTRQKQQNNRKKVAKTAEEA